MASFGQLISGFRTFKATTYLQYKNLISHIIQLETKPTTLVVACCDMRIAPGRIFGVNPGDLYVIRNVGGLVPMYDPEGKNSTIAAIEYAVSVDNVENIIIMGHAKCDAIKLLVSGEVPDGPMSRWLDIAASARDAVSEQMQDASVEEKEKSCEQEAILVSLKNLLSYPLLDKKIKEGTLMLYGVLFDIESGQLMAFDPNTKFFEPIE